VPLEVRFRQGNQDVRVMVGIDSASRPAPDKLAGEAPINTVFIGDAQVQVFQGNKKISKKTLCDETECSAYYSFDPPLPPTSLSVPGFNRLGGNLTITAAGGGFRRFESSIPGIQPVNPAVSIGAIDFAVNTVTQGTPSTINGNVRRAGPDIRSCASRGQSPCYRVRVTNPGGRLQDRVESAVPLYNLLGGPPPIPQSRFPDNGFSIGGTRITISGENLDFVDNVTVGGTDAPIISKTRTRLIVSTLPHTAGANNPIILFDIDNSASGGTTIPGGAFRFEPTPVTQVGIVSAPVYIVGPGEGVDLMPMSLSIPQNINCISASARVTIRPVPRPPGTLAGVIAFVAEGTFDCSTCMCSFQNPPCPTTRSGTVSFTLVNTAAASDTRLRLRVSRAANVPFDGVQRVCSGAF
jgi:hypothetical protein